MDSQHQLQPQSPPDADSSTSDLPPELQQLAGEAEGQAAPAPQSAPVASAQPEIPTDAFLEGMLTPAAEAFAPNWKLKPHEIKMLAKGTAAVLDYYWPKGVGSWGPWGMFLGACAAVIGPRIGTPMRLPEEPTPPATADA